MLSLLAFSSKILSSFFCLNSSSNLSKPLSWNAGNLGALVWTSFNNSWFASSAWILVLFALAIATLVAWLSISSSRFCLPAIAPCAKKDASDRLAFCKLTTAAFCSAKAAFVFLKAVRYSLAALLAWPVPKATSLKFLFDSAKAWLKLLTLFISASSFLQH